MKRVIIESPFAGEVAENIAYAKRCVQDCLNRGEAPYASHLFFTQEGLLDDLIPEQRDLGIKAGFAWGKVADLVVVYIDRGVSGGMRKGIETAKNRSSDIEIRSLERKITKKDYIELDLAPWSPFNDDVDPAC